MRLALGLMAGCAAIAGVLAISGKAAAQSAPGTRVRIVVPYVAGGPTDVIARIVADKLGERWKQNVGREVEKWAKVVKAIGATQL